MIYNQPAYEWSQLAETLKNLENASLCHYLVELITAVHDRKTHDFSTDIMQL